MGFESSDGGTGTGGYQYAPTGTGVGWTFSAYSGVSGNGSGFTFGNPDAPQGAQVGILDQLGTISQVVTLAQSSLVQVSFLAAQRDDGSLNAQSFSVSLGGTVVGTFTPGGASYEGLSTTPLLLAAGTHDLVFTGLNPLGGDNTAFLDAVTVAVLAVVVSAYSYDGDGLRRSAQEAGAAGPTTFIWDGDDYLGEY